MQPDLIISMVGSLGFPIVACIAMAIFIATSFRTFNELITRNNALIEELIYKFDSNIHDNDNGNDGVIND